MLAAVTRLFSKGSQRCQRWHELCCVCPLNMIPGDISDFIHLMFFTVRECLLEFKGIEIKYKYLIVSFSGLKRSNLIYYFECKIQSHDCHSACCVCACMCVSVAKKQCCLSSVKESRCELGMISARGGDTCEMKEEKQCTDDSYQVRYCLTTTRTPKAMLLSKTSGICFDVLYKMMHAVERDKKQEEDG